MPLFYQQNINEETRLAVWKIEEPAMFFESRVPIKKDVSHPHKRLQHLAGRFLLPSLFNDFPLEEIIIADTRKPFLKNEKYHFSISHSSDFAAAIVSKNQRVGVDVEVIVTKIEKIRHKFMSDAEYELAKNAWGLHDQLENREDKEFALQTLIWSAKESIYKWYGDGLVDFKEHMILCDFPHTSPKKEQELSFMLRKGKQKVLQIKGRFFGSMVLTWVVS
jgi:4'-phosphopantetheinyl transferase EntD